MFNVRPNLRVPGFNVRESEEEVPGFRLNVDGTIGKAPIAAAKPNDNPFDVLGPQPLAAWPPPYLAFSRDLGTRGLALPAAGNGYSPFPGAAVRVADPGAAAAGWAANSAVNRRHLNVRGIPVAIARGTFLDDIKELPEAVADRVGAFAKGAYSIFPGVYNTGRAAARGLGLLGPEEAERFRRELELIRSSANAIVEHPGDAARVAYYGADERLGDPLLKYHLLGRGAMGWLARVGYVPFGPIALVGDTLRAFENGRQNLVDALLDGIQGER